MYPPAGVMVAGRLAGNRLLPGTELAGAAEVVAALCGVQAQDLPAARLAVRARSTGLTDAGVEAARTVERSFVRTWAMRGTLHLVAAKDLGWIRRLLSPGIIRSSARRSAQLGLDEATYRRAIRLIADELSSGVRSRAQLREALVRQGVDASGQRGAYLLLRASVEGLICEGPVSQGKPGYVLAKDWLGGLPEAPEDHDSDLARLVSRYLSAYGPAAPQDLAAWSGLAISECREAFGLCDGDLEEMSIGGRPAWSLSHRGDVELANAPAGLRLLPAFDTFLLGYRDRDLHLSPRHARHFNAGGGMVRPVLLVDGRVEGTWQLIRRPGALEAKVRPFGVLPRSRHPELEQEASDIGRFLEMPASLTLER